MFPLYVIYRFPSDYPEHFVVRCWYGPVPDQEPFCLAPTLEAARAALPPGLAHLARDPNDDPAIAEVWI
jgi:hypothetical protein